MYYSACYSLKRLITGRLRLGGFSSQIKTYMSSMDRAVLNFGVQQSLYTQREYREPISISKEVQSSPCIKALSQETIQEQPRAEFLNKSSKQAIRKRTKRRRGNKIKIRVRRPF